MEMKQSTDLKRIASSIWGKHKNIILAVICALVTAWIFLFLFPARFETNDDTGMAQIAYGARGFYSSHLIFINVLVGRILRACLETFPTVPWYTVFQVALVCISFVIIFYLLFEKFGSKAIFPIVILSAYFGYEFLSRIQFSKTAGIAVIAGFLLLFDAIENRRHILAYLCGGGVHNSW